MKVTAFWDIAVMMEAVSTSETSVNFYQTTRRNIPEDSHLRKSGRLDFNDRYSFYQA
jgi:hypothetical protein